jgi:hypothetical protein
MSVFVDNPPTATVLNELGAMDTLRRYTHCAHVESLASSLFEQDKDSLARMSNGETR